VENIQGSNEIELLVQSYVTMPMGRPVNKQNIMQEMELLLPEYTEFLAGLVQIESCYGREGAAQLFVKNKMEEIGLNVHVFHSRKDEESLNLVAKIRGADSNKHKSLVLNAHCDVAPVDDPERWTVPPFSGAIIEGMLYGRGAQDDKAGIAIMLLISHILRNTGTVLNGDLIIQSVIEDESTGNGSKVLVDNGYTADGVIIVDGTWANMIIYAHLGQIWLDITVTGEPVPACVAWRGVNPIHTAMELIQHLELFIKELNASSSPFETIDNPFFMNLGSFNSGVWHGSVPSFAKMEVQIGFPDSISVEDLVKKLTTVVNSVYEKVQIRENILKTPPFTADRNNVLIKKLRSFIVNSGKAANEVAVSGHCDMRHFPTPNICLYGPGGGKSAHGIDEYYLLDQMPVVTANLLDFICEWCNERT